MLFQTRNRWATGHVWLLGENEYEVNSNNVRSYNSVYCYMEIDILESMINNIYKFMNGFIRVITVGMDEYTNKQL